MQLIAYLVYLAVQWKIAVILVLIAAAVIWPFVSSRLFARKKRTTRRGTLWLPMAGLAAFILLVFFGNGLATNLVHAHGVPGEAIVTDQFATADVHNEQRVFGFNVLIRTREGQVVRTSFRTDSFNVYPYRNQTRYPGPGVRFNVRYLPDHPQAFVIIADDDSQWARSLRCGESLQRIAQTTREASFAPGNPAFARARDDAVAAARAGGCIPGAP